MHDTSASLHLLEYAVAIFDRARDALELVESTPLLVPALRGDVAAWLDRYGIAVV